MKKPPGHWRETDRHQADEARRYEKPIPSREYLLATLGELGRPADLDALTTHLGLKEAGLKRALEQRLKAMVRDGQLVRNRRAEYLITDRTTLTTGTVIGHRDGFG